jgi:hypothetical protein
MVSERVRRQLFDDDYMWLCSYNRQMRSRERVAELLPEYVVWVTENERLVEEYGNLRVGDL